MSADLRYKRGGKFLKPCPLCGTRVSLEVECHIFLSPPHEPLPIYNVRCRIKCPTDFLTLDLAWNGYADAEGKSEAEERSMIVEICRTHEQTILDIWNNRGGAE